MRGIFLLQLLFLLSLYQYSNAQNQNQDIVTTSPSTPIPLRLIAITPLEGNVLTVSGTVPITVIFNRAVIALGSDFGPGPLPPSMVPLIFPQPLPGRWRWVTTSISVFEPLTTWPTDLNLTVNVNLDLTTFDNATLELPNPSTYQLVTPKLSYFYGFVNSKIAANLTNNQWSASMPYSFDSNVTITDALEVPPDGLIILYFSNGINSSMIMPSMQLLDANKNVLDVSFIFYNCTNNCLNFSISQPLNISTQYTFKILAGARYGLESGPLSTEISIKLYGLYDFRFTFKSNFEMDHPRYTRYRLFLRHGLSPNTDLVELSSSIKFTPPIPFEITRPSLEFIQISAMFQPNTTYSISIEENNKILDGFGLPLKSSNATFTTVQLPFFEIRPTFMGDGVIFEKFSQDWMYLFQNGTDCNPLRIRAQPFYSSDIDKIHCDQIFSYPQCSYGFEHSTTFDFGCSEPSMQGQFRLDNTFLDESSVFVVEETHRIGSFYSWKNVYHVERADLAVSILSASIGSLVWVTRMSSNENFPGVNITMLVNGTYFNEISDENGIANFILPLGNQARMFIQINGTVLIFPSTVYLPYQYSTSVYSAVIIPDRNLYRPGELIHMKGYIKSSGSPPSFPDLNSVVYFEDQQNQFHTIQQNITYDNRDLGTFSYTIQVPQDIKYQYYTISLLSVNNVVSAYSSIQVADPRLPTITLDLHTQDKVYKPEIGVNLTLIAGYYFGTPLSDYPIKLSWTLNRRFTGGSFFNFDGYNLNSLVGSDQIVGTDWLNQIRPITGTQESGSLNLTTDVNGQVTYHFQIPTQVSNGDSISITSQLFAPSGELLEKSITLSVAKSEWKIIVSVINQDAIPGYSSTFLVDLQGLNSNFVPNSTINGKIYHWDPKQTIDPNNLLIGNLTGTNLTLMQECEFMNNRGKYPVCVYQVPTMGKFLAVFTTVDPFGVIVGTSVPFGKTEEEWIRYPLRSLSGLSVEFTSSKYAVGEPVKINFLNPFSSAQMLVTWGSLQKVNYQIFILDNGNDTLNLNQISIPVGSECQSTCNFQIVVHSPRQPPTFKPPITVPTSPLFDWFAPKSFSYGTSVQILHPEPKLNIQIQNQPVALPGENVTVTINLLDENGLPQDGEVAVFIVDESVLSLAPPPITNLSTEFKNERNPLYFYVASSLEYLAQEFAYLNSLEIINRRLQIDPYIVPEWRIQPTSWVNDIELPDDIYFQNYAYFLTYGSSRTIPFSSGPFSSGGRFLVDSASFGSGGRGSSVSTPFLRSNFVITPYWNPTLVPSNGTVSFSFTMPDNVGEFSIRAFAINTNGVYGNSNGKLISRREIATVVPVSPRMVRYGDMFQTGVAISVIHPSTDQVFTVDVEFTNEIVQMVANEVQSKTVEISPGESSPKVLFSFNAIKFGEAVFNYTIKLSQSGQKVSQGGQIVDMVQVKFSVLGDQEPVFIATSMAVSEKGIDGLPDVEGIKLPPYVPGTGNLSVEAGVGKLPSVSAMSDQALQVDPHYPNAVDLLISLLPKYALRNYNNTSKYQTTINLADTVYKSSLDSLKLFNSELGLRWTPTSPPFYIDQYLNSYGLFINKVILMLGGTVGITKDLTDSWMRALNGSLFASIDDPASHGPPNLDLIAMVGFSTNQLPSNALSLLVSNYTQMSISGKLFFALYLKETGQMLSLSQSLINEAKNSVRVFGRIAYVAVGTFSNSDDFQATCLLTLCLLNDTNNPTVEKMSNYISQFGRKSNTRASVLQTLFLGKQQIGFALLSLVSYDISRSNVNPDLVLTVDPLTQIKFGPNGTDYTEIKTSFESLTKDTISFSAVGQGEVSVVLGMNFVPLELFNKSVNRGIEVQKVIQVLGPNGIPTGPPVTKLLPGTEVMVTIQIDLTSSVSFLQVVDPLPGCLESLDKGGIITPCSWWRSLFSDVFCSWSYYFSFFQREVRADQVRFYGTHLSAGTHVVSYRAVVVSSGLFVIPPTKVYDVVNPEIMGLSASGKFDSMSP